MVFKIISSQRMDKDRQIIPIILKPGNEPIKLSLAKGELTTPTRVWSNHFLMHSPHLDVEQLAYLVTK